MIVLDKIDETEDLQEMEDIIKDATKKMKFLNTVIIVNLLLAILIAFGSLFDPSFSGFVVVYSALGILSGQIKSSHEKTINYFSTKRYMLKHFKGKQ